MDAAIDTLRNRFHMDFYGYLRANQPFDLSVGNFRINVEACEISDHILGGKALAFYLGPTIEFETTATILVENHAHFLKEFSSTVVIKGGRDQRQSLDSRYFRFTGTIFVYYEGKLDEPLIHKMRNIALEKNIQLIIRDLEYQRIDDLWEHPVAFICHDSGDKESIAEPLSQELMAARCPVWYYDYAVNIGDNIRESIENGIKTCRKCVLILSKRLIGNNSWAKKEFESFVSKEVVKGENVFLPVWVEVTREEVYEFSPSLAIINGIQWDGNARNIAWELKRVIELSSR